MPLNTFRRGTRTDDFPEVCGPDDLADAIISQREQRRGESTSSSTAFSSISDDGVRRLIGLAYHTSQIAEEGTYIASD